MIGLAGTVRFGSNRDTRLRLEDCAADARDSKHAVGGEGMRKSAAIATPS